ncbi:hypothetical protein JTB14_028604 [Gonioctena quinquepunctata]|nr:hypothetical protein JTB14_028604 [Gonioctena quinquepunctata]
MPTSYSNSEEIPVPFVTLLEVITRIKDENEDNLGGCGDDYYKTQLDEDWLQCVICLLWVHENCTEFEDMCSNCGNKKEKEIKDAKGMGKGKKTTGHLTSNPMAITLGHSGLDGQTYFFISLI